jgi:CheY-like chemotaxis protein
MTLEILLVDDSEAFADLLRRALSDAVLNDHLHFVRNGAEAMLYLEGKEPSANVTQHPRPDFVLLDLYMPVMDGFELIKAVRMNPRLTRLPLHAWSGAARQADIDRAYALGATSFMLKPGTLEGMQQTLLRLHRLHEIASLPPKSA